VALQAISRRVHYGKHVAEVKYQEQPVEYTRLVQAGDREGIMALLTNSAVEARLLERVRLKAAAYGTGTTPFINPPFAHPLPAYFLPAYPLLPTPLIARCFFGCRSLCDFSKHPIWIPALKHLLHLYMQLC